MLRPNYLKLLYDTRDNINKLIEREETRKRTAANEYQQRVARGQCVATAACKGKLVPGYKMCSFHLHKAAHANERYRVKH